MHAYIDIHTYNIRSWWWWWWWRYTYTYKPMHTCTHRLSYIQAQTHTHKHPHTYSYKHTPTLHFVMQPGRQMLPTWTIRRGASGIGLVGDNHWNRGAILILRAATFRTLAVRVQVLAGLHRIWKKHRWRTSTKRPDAETHERAMQDVVCHLWDPLNQHRTSPTHVCVHLVTSYYTSDVLHDGHLVCLLCS